MATRFWDAVVKLSVITVAGLATYIMALNGRLAEVEYAARKNSEAIQRIEAQHVVILQKFDKIIEALEGLGTRLTRIETKLEHSK